MRSDPPTHRAQPERNTVIERLERMLILERMSVRIKAWMDEMNPHSAAFDMVAFDALFSAWLHCQSVVVRTLRTL